MHLNKLIRVRLSQGKGCPIGFPFKRRGFIMSAVAKKVLC